MGKNKQLVCLLPATNRVSDEKLDLGVIHAESPQTAEAWELEATQQSKDERTGQYIQFVSSLSYKPIRIYRNRNGAGDFNIDVLASQTEDREMTFIDQGKQKDSRLLWVGICLALLTLTICIVVLVVVL